MKILVVSDLSIVKMDILYKAIKEVYNSTEDKISTYKVPLDLFVLNLEQLYNDGKFCVTFYVNNSLIVDLERKIKVDKIIIGTENSPEGEFIAEQLEIFIKSKGGHRDIFRLRLKSLSKKSIIKSLKKEGKINYNLSLAGKFNRVTNKAIEYELGKFLFRFGIKHPLSLMEFVILKYICENEQMIRMYQQPKIMKVSLQLENGMCLESPNIEDIKEAKRIKDDIIEAVEDKRFSIKSHKYIEPPPEAVTFYTIINDWNPSLPIETVCVLLTNLYIRNFISNPFRGPNRYSKKIIENITDVTQEEIEDIRYNEKNIPVIVPRKIYKNIDDIESIGILNEEEKSLLKFIVIRTMQSCCSRPAIYKERCISYACATGLYKRLKDPGYLDIDPYERKSIGRDISVRQVNCELYYPEIPRLKDKEVYNFYREYNQDSILSILSLIRKEYIARSKEGFIYVPSYSMTIVKLIEDSFSALHRGYLDFIKESINNIIDGGKVPSKRIKNIIEEIRNPKIPSWFTDPIKCEICGRDSSISVESGRFYIRCVAGHRFALEFISGKVSEAKSFYKMRLCPICKKFVKVIVRNDNNCNPKRITCLICKRDFNY